MDDIHIWQPSIVLRVPYAAMHYILLHLLVPFRVFPAINAITTLAPEPPREPRVPLFLAVLHQFEKVGEEVASPVVATMPGNSVSEQVVVILTIEQDQSSLQ